MRDQKKRADILQQAEVEGVEFVHLQFTDMLGIVKSVTIPADLLPGALENGVWFDGSSVEGFARIAESDMYLMPDPDTFSLVPWEDATARIICDIYTPDGAPFDAAPRWILKRATDRAREELGVIYNTGPEPEFYLFREGSEPMRDLLLDEAGYFDLSGDRAIDVRKQMVRALKVMGIQVEASHHEVGPGQQEIDFRYTDAVRSADNVVNFKYALKAIAQQNGLHATFMPKPMYGMAGSGMHVHQSLMCDGDGRNAFHEEKDEYGLSEMAKKFIAGQLAHAPALCAVVAPLVNSYKRLVAGFEAPVYIGWARINRSALIRVPRVTPERPEATRLECRCPDPSCNPYLAFAVMLEAGLDGIRRDLPLVDPVEENLYDLDAADRRKRHIETLPGTLMEALRALEADDVVRKALGERLFQRYMDAKREEWFEYRQQIHSWEVDRYFWAH